MRLIASRTQCAIHRWAAFITVCWFSGAAFLMPVVVQSSDILQPMTATPGITADEAIVSEAALIRFANIPTGVTKANLTTISFPYLGSPDAPIKVTQISSYSCSSCRNYYENITLNLLPAIRNGQVQFILVPVTLTGEYDPTNETAAALCALDQGKFWEMTDVLFNWQSRYESAATDGRRLEFAAVKLGLNLDKFTTCLLGTDVGTRIIADNQYFDTLKLHYTPSILVNGKWINPSPSLNQLYQLINQTRPDLTTIPDLPTPESTATDIPGGTIFTKLLVTARSH